MEDCSAGIEQVEPANHRHLPTETGTKIGNSSEACEKKERDDYSQVVRDSTFAVKLDESTVARIAENGKRAWDTELALH